MTWAAYLCWLVEIVVTVINCMKQSKNKQLSFYIFARCVALGLSLPLLAGFVVQSLLAMLLCQLASTGGEVLRNMAVLGTSLGPFANIWYEIYSFLDIILCCAHYPTLTFWKYVQSDNIGCKTLTVWAKWPLGLLACFYCQPVVLTTSSKNSKNINNGIDSKCVVYYQTFK